MIKHILSLGLVLTVLFAAPVMAFAQENDNGILNGVTENDQEANNENENDETPENGVPAGIGGSDNLTAGLLIALGSLGAGIGLLAATRKLQLNQR
jgi:hypothetical protein